MNLPAMVVPRVRWINPTGFTSRKLPGMPEPEIS